VEAGDRRVGHHEQVVAVVESSLEPVAEDPGVHEREGSLRERRRWFGEGSERELCVPPLAGPAGGLRLIEELTCLPIMGDELFLSERPAALRDPVPPFEVLVVQFAEPAHEALGGLTVPRVRRPAEPEGASGLDPVRQPDIGEGVGCVAVTVPPCITSLEEYHVDAGRHQSLGDRDTDGTGPDDADLGLYDLALRHRPAVREHRFPLSTGASAPGVPRIGAADDVSTVPTQLLKRSYRSLSGWREPMWSCCPRAT
jgi:hypothetical protein